MNTVAESPETEMKRLKKQRQRQILSCKNCKSKKVKCEMETNQDILNSLSMEQKLINNPCKQCVKRGVLCEYFEKVDTKKQVLQKQRSKKKEERLARLHSADSIESHNDSKLIKRRKMASVSIESSLSVESADMLPANQKYTTNSISTLSNTLNLNPQPASVTEMIAQVKSTGNGNISPLPSAQELLTYGISATASSAVPGPSLLSSTMNHFALSPNSLLNSNSTLKDLANVVSNEMRNKSSLTNGHSQPAFFVNGLPNPLSPSNSSQHNQSYIQQQNYNQNDPSNHTHIHNHQQSVSSPYQKLIHRHQMHQPVMHPLNPSTRVFNTLPQKSPSASSPTPSLIRNTPTQKRQSPIEINNILKPLSASNIVSQPHMNQHSPLTGPLNPMQPQQPLPLLQNQTQESSSQSFAEKYFSTTTQRLENPLRKLDLHSIQKEAVFSCSAVSVRPWFEHSKLVKKHKSLFDHLREKSHDRRDKEKGSGIGSIKKDRMLLLSENSEHGNNGAKGQLWERIVDMLPQMHILREIIVAYFNSELHLYIRVLDRVSVFNILEKYFIVENNVDIQKDAANNIETEDEKWADDRIVGLNLTANDNFFNVGIVLQIYRIVMAKQLTEEQDDLFRNMEINLNGISSGFIWSFTKLQFSILCYLQRHLDLEMSDFGFNFKILAEHITSSCLKVGLNKGVHKFITNDNKIPEWTLKNLYFWSHYFDLIHSLESGSPLIIPFDPIIEEQELKCSERGRDGLLRRFVLLGRKIVNALFEPYGRPDFEGMLAKIDEFERLELLPMNSYCNLSTISNVDLFDYSVLIPLMNLKLTLNKLRYFVDNEDENNVDYNYFFGICFAILAVVIVLREQWQSSLHNKEVVLSFKEPKAINVDHLSYFHSLAVQRDLIDKVGITFYEMLYLLKIKDSDAVDPNIETASTYSSDDILSFLISLVLVKQPLPNDLNLKTFDLLKCFMIMIERFYKVDTFGKEQQPNIHFKEFETIFRNIYTGNNNLESALTPKIIVDSSQNNCDINSNPPIANADSVGASGGIWQKSPIDIYNSTNNNPNPPIPPIWSEDDVNILQLFDIDFTTFLTPFL